jgi:hypothetical protein
LTAVKAIAVESYPPLLVQVSDLNHKKTGSNR